ncbi:hypothetical protein D3C72_2146400 [compost metagenome]
MPTSVPTMVVSVTTARAIISEMREPTMPRDRISRPNLSVPSSWIGRPSVVPKKWMLDGMNQKKL